MSQQIPQVAYRLRDYEFPLFLKSSLGAPIPLVGTTWTFTLRRASTFSGSGPVELTGSSAGGEVTITNASGGELFIAFPAVSMVLSGGLMIAELVQTNAGLKMSGRWHVYVGEEDEVPLSTIDIVSIGSQQLVVYAYDALLLGALSPGNDNIALTFLLDGGSSPVVPGSVVWLRIPFNCTLIESMLMADVPTTAVVDVWKDDSSAFPPTLADTITASDKPTLVNAVRVVDADIATWATSVAMGDVIMAVVESNDNATKLNLSLTAVRSP
jgi:hypothetical protein